MKKNILLIITAAAFVLSCNTVPKDLNDENITPEEFFQKAQEAVINWSRYDTAICYYEEFIARFPDMKAKIIEAEYEIAFIKYKQKKYGESKKLFYALLDKYNTDEAVYYPEWPKILSNKILDIIEKEEEKEAKKFSFKNLFKNKNKRQENSEEKDLPKS